MAITGGIRGAPVELAACETIDLPCVADAEIVLEGEILPTGWTQPEGGFGEFTGAMGGLHWNPDVRVKAVLMRPDAIYYALHMPLGKHLAGSAHALSGHPSRAQDRGRSGQGTLTSRSGDGLSGTQ